MAEQAEIPYLDIYVGDQAAYDTALAEYEATKALLQQNAKIYGFPTVPEELSEEQQGILQELKPDEPLRLSAPISLLAGRLMFHLDPSQGLAKTRANFISLCKGDRGMCKNAPKKALHYLNVPIHRIVKGYIAQGGDVTRLDGSGGESIYGGKFNDEKEGLKSKFKLGSLGMANSGKNSNTSQFFITLTDDETKLAKLNGKYIAFGQVQTTEEAMNVLRRLDEVGPASGDSPTEKVWIGGCGVL
ncbi:hypothetical protein FRC03_003315 [Tulasnella sp. 419]|nr:hypothetical protein FRC03_003315 [Tulasnella sp. 419]